MANYEYWQEALEGKKPAITTEPMLGFYRKRTKKGGLYVPVAIWEAEGSLKCIVNGEAKDAHEEWTYCADHPVTEEAYRAKVAGKPWPDEDGAIALIGHNSATDPFDLIKDEIASASAGVKDYAEINDDELAARAVSLRNRLNELCRNADVEREKQKKPYLQAGREVDEKWQPLIKGAKAESDKIRASLSGYETRKAAKAAILGVKPAAETMQTKTAYGKAASVRTIKVVTAITDQDALYQFVSKHPELIATLQHLAQRAVDAGLSPPGVTIDERKDVR